jgi:hypothetical protein
MAGTKYQESGRMRKEALITGDVPACAKFKPRSEKR